MESMSLKDRQSPHRHGATQDSPSGAFGPSGIFRLQPFRTADGRTHVAVGIHSGRVRAQDATVSKGSGPHYVTNGCIRTSNEAMQVIEHFAAHDPLQRLTVLNNFDQRAREQRNLGAKNTGAQEHQ